MNPFTAEVVRIIRGIPAGKVMSYGQIAEWAGSRRGARQVVRILHSMSGPHDLPWHRVVNVRGEIALQSEELKQRQRELLEREGVELLGGDRIDLEKYRYIPLDDDSAEHR